MIRNSLKYGSSILIKKPHELCGALGEGKIYTVIGFNSYLGQKTYRFKTVLDNGLIQTTHCIVRDVDELISKDYFEICKQKRGKK